MPDLLLELFSEEIPARMQAGAARDLERLVVGALSDRGLLFEGIKAFAGPRRLTLAVSGLPAKQADVREELKGPKIDAPTVAIEGFLKKTGLSKDQLKIEKTPKGDVYIAVIEREGRETASVLAEILPEAMAKLPWPKSMRWKPGVTTRWVRPLHSILCTFDGETVPFAFAGVSSGRHTKGHRFLAPEKIEVRRFDDYAAALKKAFVVLEADERAAIIFEGVKQAAFVHGLELIPDEGLLAEVSGLVEWPVIFVGAIEDQFMDVPAEILQTAMRTHQKYFALRDPKTGKMANRFALVANMVAEDGGKEIVAGNERVLRARLSDAKFFWDEDRKTLLENWSLKLKGVVFHAKLGNQMQRIARVGALSREIAKTLNLSAAQVEMAHLAGDLSKADLVTGIVGEFPELQGVMGGYYAQNEGMAAEISEAIRNQYKPLGPTDIVPTSGVSIAVALADKIDTLFGFFLIDERPSGSKDPFALRRSAIGLVRIILENNLRFSLREILRISGELHVDYAAARANVEVGKAARKVEQLGFEKPDESEQLKVRVSKVGPTEMGLKSIGDFVSAENDLITFIIDRLKVALREKGVRHDLIDAVFSLGTEDDLVRLVARVEALQAFLKTDDGVNLLAGYKRAANILKDEEKKDKKAFTGEVDEKQLTEPAEKTLFAALQKARTEIAPALAKEDFAGAMRHMAALRVPVDAFFDSVKVNAPEPKIRENRLHLLAALRATVHQIGDFSKIESPQVAKR
jgi:glycyl-tRNA synthetase beta chain